MVHFANNVFVKIICLVCSRHVLPTTTQILNNKAIHRENQKNITIDERHPASENYNNCWTDLRSTERGTCVDNR